MSILGEITGNPAPMYTWYDARRIFSAKTLERFIRAGEVTAFRVSADEGDPHRAYRFPANEIRALAKEYGLEHRL